MAESTLSGAYSDYREEIAFYLGYGRTSTSWTTAQESTIASVLKTALRQFYHPPKLPDMDRAHDWSFMHPVTTLTVGATAGTVSGLPVYDGAAYSTITATTAVFETRMAASGTTITFDTSEESYAVYSVTSTSIIVVEGDASGETTGDTIAISAQYEYDLPDAFGAMNGGFTFDTNNPYDVVKVCAETQIRDMRQGATGYTGRPLYAAIRPTSTTGAAGQRFEVLFHPTPDGSYTLTYSYIPLMSMLTDTYPYPWGGEPHTETVLASCLAAAEERIEDARGEKYQRFLERLRASIDWDNMATAPQTLGYNGDRSSHNNSFRYNRSNNLVTVV